MYDLAFWEVFWQAGDIKKLSGATLKVSTSPSFRENEGVFLYSPRSGTSIQKLVNKNEMPPFNCHYLTCTEINWYNQVVARNKENSTKLAEMSLMFSLQLKWGFSTGSNPK
jgi:hypothetical protein